MGLDVGMSVNIDSFSVSRNAELFLTLDTLNTLNDHGDNQALVVMKKLKKAATAVIR